MRVGWNYAWRFSLGAVLGAGTAALLAVGIATGGTGLLVGGVAGCALIAVYTLTVIMPWTRAWATSLPLAR